MVEGEPKKVVNYRIDDLPPKILQRTVKNEMARESNKPLLKSVVAFITWLLTSCKEYLRWEPPTDNSTDKAAQPHVNNRQSNKKADRTRPRIRRRMNEAVRLRDGSAPV
ncbi:hypothetical protein PHYPSEUDO_002669 [Phytophthora pseudosyringae]|uniref:Uncharacterized protein n=1 Tax=Phytophthora pseudosyringae TaxID=221518 RepID=A0A8T1WJ46_9STRA|nr:hypothetical protein PHYPSEUDO_002669 [Phytophthora pseudosyringae]